MMFEFKTVWPFINIEGLLTCDDATGNDAFLDFADSVARAPVIVKDWTEGRRLGFGAIRK